MRLNLKKLCNWIHKEKLSVIYREFDKYDVLQDVNNLWFWNVLKIRFDVNRVTYRVNLNIFHSLRLQLSPHICITLPAQPQHHHHSPKVSIRSWIYFLTNISALSGRCSYIIITQTVSENPSFIKIINSPVSALWIYVTAALFSHDKRLETTETSQFPKTLRSEITKLFALVSKAHFVIRMWTWMLKLAQKEEL